MTTQASFTLKGRNPDILTSIANLSSDEVFTPPQFANRMLDGLQEAWAKANSGQSIWENSELTFLDPFTKSGVFLREIAARLIDGLAMEIPSLQERVNHVLTKQVFGIGLTELTALLARRSLYCSKNANGPHSICTAFTSESGNVWFEPMEHSWKSGKCTYCKANQRDYDRNASESYAYPLLHTENLGDLLAKAFGGQMKFDVVIGNPPYQLGQSGGDSVGGFAMPIYQKFIDAAKSLDPRFITMVTPSRWFAGGRGLDEFRAEMLADRRLTTLVDFPNSADVFPGVDIKGGVSYFLWDSTANGTCTVTTCTGDEAGVPVSRYLNAYDVLIRRNEAVPILEKVLAKASERGLRFLSEDISPIQPFSIRTNFRGKESPAGLKDPVLLYQNGGTSFISKEDIPRNQEWVDDWKVLIVRAAGSGHDQQVLTRPVLAQPKSACTETYLVAGRFSNEAEARNLDSYLRSRFLRFLVSLRKYTQDIYSERFSFVPKLDPTRTWTDSELYAEFDLTANEIRFIESMISPMESSDASH